MYFIRIVTNNEKSEDVYKFLHWYKEHQTELVRGSFYPRLKQSQKRGIVAFNEICKTADVQFQSGRRCLNFLKNKFDIMKEQIIVENEDFYKILVEEFLEFEFKIEDQPVSVPVEEQEFDKLGHIKSMLKEEYLDITESLDLVRWLLDDIQKVYEEPGEKNIPILPLVSKTE